MIVINQLQSTPDQWGEEQKVNGFTSRAFTKGIIRFMLDGVPISYGLKPSRVDNGSAYHLDMKDINELSQAAPDLLRAWNPRKENSTECGEKLIDGLVQLMLQEKLYIDQDEDGTIIRAKLVWTGPNDYRHDTYNNHINSIKNY